MMGDFFDAPFWVQLIVMIVTCAVAGGILALVFSLAKTAETAAIGLVLAILVAAILASVIP